jgi:hypothetical protein
VGLGDVAGQREQQRERVLGGRDDVGLRRVGDHDAALGGRGHVDVVDAHAGAADRLQARGLVDQVGGDLRRAADQEPVELADARLEVEPVGVEAGRDVEVLLQQRDAAGADVLGDEDLGHAPCPTT